MIFCTGGVFRSMFLIWAALIFFYFTPLNIIEDKQLHSLKAASLCFDRFLPQALSCKKQRACGKARSFLPHTSDREWSFLPPSFSHFVFCCFFLVFIIFNEKAFFLFMTILLRLYLYRHWIWWLNKGLQSPKLMCMWAIDKMLAPQSTNLWICWYSLIS